MSVLIRGMEMPKDGVYWCEIGVVGEIATITIHGEDRKSFHLVPIPPHGRLIDADRLADIFRGFIAMYDSCPFSLSDIARRNELQSILAEVINAPVIIPVSKEDEI